MIFKKFSIAISIILYATVSFSSLIYSNQSNQSNMFKAVADLTISDISITPAVPSTTDTIVVKAACTNLGDKSAENFYVSFKIGGESKPSTYFIKSLEPHQSHQLVREVHLTHAQNYLVTVKADIYDKVNEGQNGKDNNVKTFSFKVLAPGENPISSGINIVQKPKPTSNPFKGPVADLTITEISVTPANPLTTDTIVVKAVCTNLGDISASNFYVGFKIGGESNPPVYLISDLGPNKSHQLVREVRLTRPQKYLVTVKADIYNRVGEGHNGKDNNDKTISFKVLAPGKADLK